MSVEKNKNLFCFSCGATLGNLAKITFNIASEEGSRRNVETFTVHFCQKCAKKLLGAIIRHMERKQKEPL